MNLLLLLRTEKSEQFPALLRRMADEIEDTIKTHKWETPNCMGGDETYLGEPYNFDYQIDRSNHVGIYGYFEDWKK